jgi:hypothetical protein
MVSFIVAQARGHARYLRTCRRHISAKHWNAIGFRQPISMRPVSSADKTRYVTVMYR